MNKRENKEKGTSNQRDKNGMNGIGNNEWERKKERKKKRKKKERKCTK